MYIFCVLWVPLFYLFRRSIAGEGGAGSVWALILGSISALIQFFSGALVSPGGFGLSRWMSAFVDIVGLPVLIPLLVAAAFILFRLLSGNIDFTNFTLLWLIPVAVSKALSWSAIRSPIQLVMVPLLWTGLAVGISLFINCIIRYLRWWTVILCGLGILILPLAAITSYWAIFSQNTMLGYLLFSLAMIPMLVSLTLDYLRNQA